jgi:hypothetical protein
MKRILLLFSLGIIISSCSNNETDASEPFFNLSNGNLWVYKRYHSADNVNYTFSNQIDSVRVTGDTLIGGISFSKLQHKTYNSGILNDETLETLRVNSAGHLVNQNNLVYHSGTDLQYQNVRDFLVGGIVNVGSIAEQLLEPFTTNIEGIDYFVYSYYGNFTPLDTSLPNSHIFFQYKEGLGLVCQHCAAASGFSCFEDRLVYYEIN